LKIKAYHEMKGGVLIIDTISSKNVVCADVDWMVFSKHALNIDGGTIDWTTILKAQTSKRKRGNEFTVHGTKRFIKGKFTEPPQVMADIYAIDCKNSDPSKPLSFSFEAYDVMASQFSWRVDLCHRECFNSIAFSWVAVPKGPEVSTVTAAKSSTPVVAPEPSKSGQCIVL
jgi:hypothetical protein